MNNKIQLKRYEVKSLYELLEALKGVYPVKVKYAISKNKSLLKSEYESIQESLKTSVQEYTEYERAYADLLTEHVERTEEGQPVMQSANSYKLKADSVELFKEQALALREKYAEAFTKREEEIKEASKLLEESIEIPLHQVSIEDVPAELDQTDYDIFFSLVRDEE